MAFVKFSHCSNLCKHGCPFLRVSEAKLLWFLQWAICIWSSQLQGFVWPLSNRKPGVTWIHSNCPKIFLHQVHSAGWQTPSWFLRLLYALCCLWPFSFDVIYHWKVKVFLYLCCLAIISFKQHSSHGHSCKKCFCLRDPVFWGGIFFPIFQTNFPNDPNFS